MTEILYWKEDREKSRGCSEWIYVGDYNSWFVRFLVSDRKMEDDGQDSRGSDAGQLEGRPRRLEISSSEIKHEQL